MCLRIQKRIPAAIGIRAITFWVLSIASSKSPIVPKLASHSIGTISVEKYMGNASAFLSKSIMEVSYGLDEFSDSVF